MVLDPIPQSLPVHFFGSRPQPPTSPLLRLAVKKFGHPAGKKKIKLKNVKRNKPKTTKNLIEKIGNREIAAVR